jgi:DNA polymerase-3 subunit gamma/tau
MLNPQKEEVVAEKSGPLETKAFTEAELLGVWKEYAEEIKEKDLDIYTTLTRHSPKLIDKSTINLKLDNKAQEHEITDIKVDLLGFIRHRLNNYEVDLKTYIEKGSEEKGLYTSADKFKKMAQKNPALEELKKKLDLDLGF